MLNLLITDSSLYCAQWDYQEDKPVLFSLVKVKFHSDLSTIRSDADGIQNTIRTAISQIDDFNVVQRATGCVILDRSLTEKGLINIGELSNKNEIENFLLWTLKKRWGTQINHLSFSFIPGTLHYFYFAFPRLLLNQLNIILNEFGLVNVSYMPIELFFQSEKSENGVLFNVGQSESLFCFTETGIMSCKISKKKNKISFTDIIGNIEKIKSKIGNKNFDILRAEKVESTQQLLKRKQIYQSNPFQNITTDSINLKMNIPDRILNTLGRSIAKHSEWDEINYYLNPFINIMDNDKLVDERSGSALKNDSTIDKKDRHRDENKKEQLSIWISFFLFITLSGLILLKNGDIEYWRGQFIQIFHQSNNPEKSITQISDNSMSFQFEPYYEYNLSQTILNVTVYSFENIPLENITFLSSSDNRYTMVSSVDTFFSLFSSIGVIDNEIELKDNKYQIDLTLKTEEFIPSAFIQSVEEVLSVIGNIHTLSSHRKLEEKANDKFIYDPLILGFTNFDSPLNILHHIKELGGNVLVRKIEYIPSMNKIEKSSLTIYLSVIKVDLE